MRTEKTTNSIEKKTNEKERLLLQKVTDIAVSRLNPLEWSAHSRVQEVVDQVIREEKIDFSKTSSFLRKVLPTRVANRLGFKENYPEGQAEAIIYITVSKILKEKNKEGQNKKFEDLNPEQKQKAVRLLRLFYDFQDDPKREATNFDMPAKEAIPIIVRENNLDIDVVVQNVVINDEKAVASSLSNSFE